VLRFGVGIRKVEGLHVILQNIRYGGAHCSELPREHGVLGQALATRLLIFHAYLLDALASWTDRTAHQR
jgi:hypothetical protein